MKKYNLIGYATISLYTTVEANSEEEALEIAKDRERMQILSDNLSTPAEFWMADELDGEVTEIRIEQD